MILVTGGAGFIGANLLRALNKVNEAEILAVDEVGTLSESRNLAGVALSAYLHKSALWEWLEAKPSISIESVVHLGACSDTTEMDVDYLTANNVEYSQRLWRWCADRRVPFVYASSAATYGDGSQGFSDAPDLIPDLKPLNPYARSKQTFDIWAQQQQFAPPGWAGLKFFNVYGPFEHNKGHMASMVHQAFQQVQQQKNIRLYKSERPDVEDGGQRRDFVYVGDVVEVIKYFLTGTAPSGIYNVGTGNARSFNDMALSVLAACNAPERIEYIDMPSELKARYQYFTEADLTRLRISGFNQVFTSLEAGVQACYEAL